MFKSFWAFALSLSLVTSLELNERAPAVTGCAYPSLASTISACKTASAFCSGVLHRAPATSTISVKTYTTTVPASTLTYSIVKTIKTSFVTITSGTTTDLSTVISCIDSSPTAANHRIAAVTAAPALGNAKTSCGVGGYNSAWITTACECDYDTTVYKAGTTVTVTSGTSLIQTTAKPTTTITTIVAVTTIRHTTTILKDNCYPPADSYCLNAGGCNNGYFYSFICGSNDYYDCYCGSDITGRSTCFQAYNITCSDYYGGDYEPCNANADCPGNKFCLENYCSCRGQTGFVGVCAVPDVCLGDVTSIKTQTIFDKAKKTAMPVI